MKKHLIRYSVAYVLLALFLAFWGGQFITEWWVYVEEAKTHGETADFWGRDFWTQFGQSTLENWQSEVLQVMIAAWVFKHFFWKGSPESKEPPV